MMTTIVTDAEIVEAFKNTHFGSTDHKAILIEGVRKTAIGYHNGFTLTQIIRKLGLGKQHGDDAGENDLTEKGLNFLIQSAQPTPSKSEPSNELWYSHIENGKHVFTENRTGADGEIKLSIPDTPSQSVVDEPLLPTKAGVYVWRADSSIALVLVDKRPSDKEAGGILKGHVIDSTKFYDGCSIDKWTGGYWLEVPAQLNTKPTNDAIDSIKKAHHQMLLSLHYTFLPIQLFFRS